MTVRITLPLISSLTLVQPVGAVMVALPLAETAASMTLPELIADGVVGLGIIREVPVAPFAALLTDLKLMLPDDGGCEARVVAVAVLEAFEIFPAASLALTV